MTGSDGQHNGWEPRELGEVAELKRGLSWSVEQEREFPSETAVPVLRIPNVQERLDLSDVLYLDGVSEGERAACAVSRGWNLVVASNGNPNRVGNSVFIDRDMEVVFASFLVALGPKNTQALHPSFLARLLRSDTIQRAISRNVQGSTGLSNINLGLLMRSRIELPPLAEQISISAILDAVDAAIHATRGVIEQTRRLKTAVLQDLLTRGLPGRHSEFKPSKWWHAIPSSWREVRVGDIMDGTPQNGLYLPEDRYGSGTPIVRINDFSFGSLIAGTMPQRVGLDGDEGSQYLLSAGDVIINRVNSLDLLGKVGLVTDLDEPTVFESNMMRFRTKPDEIEAGLLVTLLSAHGTRRQINAMAKRAVAQASVDQGDVADIIVPVPPAEDRAQIHALIEALRLRELAAKLAMTQRVRLKRALSQALLTGRVRVPAANTTKNNAAVAAGASHG